MAELDFILQAVTTANHADAIRGLLGIEKPTQILVSVAFVRESGLDALEEAIRPLTAKAKFFVGIRNDITSIQAIKHLLAMKIELYAVDTGSRNTIFHPKLYFSANEKQAIVIIGSANLTFGGLHNNIEASTIMRLDLSDPADKKFANEATNAFVEMLYKHPQHVFLIKDDKHADEIFESGRLADENVIPAPPTTSSVKKGERDNLKPMKLHKAARTHIKISSQNQKPNKKSIKTTKVAATSLTEIQTPPAQTTKYLVWESKELTERDLSIPKSAGTHQTGSMGWKKGAFEDIDHRHYFRDDVFSGLNWIKDPQKPSIERAQAKFELIVKNLNYGVFDLKLSHKTDTQSATYKQNNFMTQIHWGESKVHIAKNDLLGRILYLYRKDTDPPEFTIEID